MSRALVIVLAPHDASWAASYDEEASLLSAAFGDVLIALHHIGSTAIPGIVAKPVIDMLAMVTSVELLDERPNALEPLRYESMGEFGVPGRRYFRKDSATGVRTHQLHAFAIGSLEIDRHLNFRDYLRAHETEAVAYDTLKRELATRAGGDTRAYSDGKTAFVHEMDRRAALWRG